MSKPIIWVNGDCLSPHSPALEKYAGSPAIWVWDDALIAEWQLSLKRITFIYECLMELPVEIRRGEVAQELMRFARENNTDRVVTTSSPSPKFAEICDLIRPHLDLEVLVVEPFFDYDGFIDLKRFSRYWKVAEKYVFRPNNNQNISK